MNYLLLFLLIGSLTATFGKPFQMEETNDSDIEEAEYESDSGVSSDESLGNDKSRQNDLELTHQEDDITKKREFESNEGSYLQHSTSSDEKSNLRFSDYKTARTRDSLNEELYDSNNSNDKFQDSSDARQLNSITDRSDSDQNNYRPGRMQNNVLSDKKDDRIMIEPQISKEDSSMLFSDNREQISKIAKNEYNNNEASDSSEQSQYFKKYYNTMQAENRGMKIDKNQENTHLNLNRDRRQVLESNNVEPVNLFSNSQNGGETLEKSAGEDEEAAIKRHIRKLSGEELEDLLNSLSEEKQVLLKRIIDSDVNSFDGSDNISKREITKKALEENFIDNGQSDSSKVQESSSSFSINTEASASQNSESTDITKLPDNQTENTDITSAKRAESNNSENSALNSSNDDSKPDGILNTYTDDKNAAELASNNKVKVKNENKRETNLHDITEINESVDDTNKIESDFNTNDLQIDSSDQGCFCSPDEDMSQVIDEEAQLSGDTRSIYKRQAVQSDLPDSVKSNLEESFPNSDAYDETGPYSYSGPLIRVKRTNPNQNLKKRAAASLLSNAKVAYVPYRAENDDEDNDEGSEFDDDAFYDRNSHFANGNIKALELDSSSNKLELNSRESKRNDIDFKANAGNNCKLSKNENLESDTMSLGTDTDSVLSGVEGVDENLMYSSGVRKRRTADDGSIQMEAKPIRQSLSTSLADDVLKAVSINVPNYQESDQFGPLPITYESDSSRYKRIRGVKQSHTTDDAPAD